MDSTDASAASEVLPVQYSDALGLRLGLGFSSVAVVVAGKETAREGDVTSCRSVLAAGWVELLASLFSHAPPVDVDVDAPLALAWVTDSFAALRYERERGVLKVVVG